MKLLFLIAATVAFFSCTSSSNNEITSNTQQAEAPKVVKPSHEPIYISTFTFAKKDGKQLENKFKVDILTSDYLDIDLKSMGGGAGHMATKDLKPILDPDNYTSISITIATKDNKPVYFHRTRRSS